MEFKIIQRPDLLLVGMAIDVTLIEVQTSKKTQELAEYFKNRRTEINHSINNREVFGLSTDPENYNPSNDKFEYFIGVEVSDQHEIPEGMAYRTIPANEYVVFTFKGTADNAGMVHDYLYTNWLNNNNYELCDRYNIEVYDERNKGPESEESITDIYFPIRSKM